MKTWLQIFDAACDRGEDPCYAMFLADEYIARQQRKAAKEAAPMLYLFDLDDTLITGYMSSPDRNYDTWQVLPKRRARLSVLQMRGDEICIVTNQGGVAFGYVTEAQADAKIAAALQALGLARVRSSGDAQPPQVFACYSDVRGNPPWNDPVDAARRKPSGAMIREAIAAYPRAAALGVLYVGDREEDEAAAQDAGVPFQWAHVFFGDEA